MAYNRQQAVDYALEFALKRNPNFFDFSNYGGDCTNFISQCLYFGGGTMIYDQISGWFYESSFNRSPSWTGVEFLFNFLTRPKLKGLNAKNVMFFDLEVGDIIQLKAKGSTVFTHSLILTDKQGSGEKLSDYLVCTHSIDSKNRPLSSYNFTDARYLKIY